MLAASCQGLKKGFVEDLSVQMNADGQYDRLPALAAELVQSRLEVITAVCGA
jgi:hypothetical protein